jgi:5-methylcytosine-specific restriction protein A
MLLPARQCPGKGPRFRSCPNTVRGAVRYCDQCQVYVVAGKREHDQKRDESPDRKFIHSAAWKKEREHYLNLNPLCERCLVEGKELPATLVHHKDGNELNRDDSNKEALCNPCHETYHGPNRFKRKTNV